MSARNLLQIRSDEENSDFVWCENSSEKTVRIESDRIMFTMGAGSKIRLLRSYIDNNFLAFEIEHGEFDVRCSKN